MFGDSTVWKPQDFARASADYVRNKVSPSLQREVEWGRVRSAFREELDEHVCDLAESVSTCSIEAGIPVPLPGSFVREEFWKFLNEKLEEHGPNIAHIDSADLLPKRALEQTDKLELQFEHHFLSNYNHDLAANFGISDMYNYYNETSQVELAHAVALGFGQGLLERLGAEGDV